MSQGRGINRTGDGAIATRQGREIIRAGYGSKKTKGFNSSSSFN